MATRVTVPCTVTSRGEWAHLGSKRSCRCFALPRNGPESAYLQALRAVRLKCQFGPEQVSTAPRVVTEWSTGVARFANEQLGAGRQLLPRPPGDRLRRRLRRGYRNNHLRRQDRKSRHLAERRADGLHS